MFILSCSDSTPVGSGILEDDEIKVQYSEDFTITAKTVLNKASITFTALNNPIMRHYAGSVRDDVFGGVRSVETAVPASYSPCKKSAVAIADVKT